MDGGLGRSVTKWYQSVIFIHLCPLIKGSLHHIHNPLFLRLSFSSLVGIFEGRVIVFAGMGGLVFG